MRKRVLLAAAALWALGGARTARALGPGDKGTSGAQFLKIAPSARAAGMGEAFTGIADDAYALYYNPAGLGHLRQVEVAAMHEARFQGLSYNYGAVAVPVLSFLDTKEARNARGVLGLSLSNLSVSNIERRGTTETDTPSGTFGASDFAYGLGYGYALSKELSVGGQVKFIDQGIDTARGTGIGLDLGGLYRQSDRLSLGGAVRHLGPGVKVGAEKDPLPTTIVLGAAYRPAARWLAALDLILPRDNSPAFALGGEYAHPFSKLLTGSLRGGFNSSHREADGFNGISFGAGLGYNNLSFDFAFVPYGDLGDVFRYSILVRF